MSLVVLVLLAVVQNGCGLKLLFLHAITSSIY